MQLVNKSKNGRVSRSIMLAVAPRSRADSGLPTRPEIMTPTSWTHPTRPPPETQRRCGTRDDEDQTLEHHITGSAMYFSYLALRTHRIVKPS
jgi:hypothetical protein